LNLEQLQISIFRHHPLPLVW